MNLVVDLGARMAQLVSARSLCKRSQVRCPDLRSFYPFSASFRSV